MIIDVWMQHPGRYHSRPGLFHRIARALAFAYILHLLFTNGLQRASVDRGHRDLRSLFRRRPRRYSY